MIRSATAAAPVALFFALLATPLVAQPVDGPTQVRIDRVLKGTPLIDGHNDLPEALVDSYDGDPAKVDLRAATGTLAKPLQTDIPRLRKGRVGGQFWSVYIPASITGDAAIRETIVRIDIVKRIVARYPDTFELANTAADVVRIHKAGRIASLMGMEGGHQIANNMAALRQMQALGVRYMTLTHFLNNDWADSATDDPKHNGLTPFGRAVVGEMNRLGMLVDLSHVSPKTMQDAIAASKAPVIFSHSNARALDGHVRNVPDDVLSLLPANGGVVMVNFYPPYLVKAVADWTAARNGEEARLKSRYQGQPEARAAGLKAWDAANPRPRTGVGVVADHIEHIVKVAGHGAVGFGGDLDGVPYTVEGLEGVDGYPKVLAELIRRGWSDADLAKLAGGNILRALRGAEATAAAMKDVPPSTATLDTKQ